MLTVWAAVGERPITYDWHVGENGILPARYVNTVTRVRVSNDELIAVSELFPYLTPKGKSVVNFYGDIAKLVVANIGAVNWSKYPARL